MRKSVGVKKSQKKRRVLLRGIVCVGFVVVLMLLVFIVLLFLVFYLCYGKANVRSGNRSENEFLFFEWNASKNRLSTGINPKFQDLNRNGEITSEGSGIYVSEFQEEEKKTYRCSGICWCEDNRRNSLPIARSVMVAATTPLIAYYFAKQSFSDTCHNDLTEVCSDVATEVDCEPEFGDPTMYEEYQEYLRETSTQTDLGKAKYLCEGSCLMKKVEDPLLRRFIEDFHCEKLKKSGNVIVGYSYQSMKEEAIRKFQDDHLKEFCKVRSRHRHIAATKGPRLGFSAYEHIFCVNSHSFEELNPTVKCEICSGNENS